MFEIIFEKFKSLRRRVYKLQNVVNYEFVDLPRKVRFLRVAILISVALSITTRIMFNFNYWNKILARTPAARNRY